jgi:hypothetical protein
MKINGESIRGTKPLPKGETASVPATASGKVRYLFAIPKFRNNSAYPQDQLPAVDERLTLSGATAPKSVTLLGKGASLTPTYKDGTITVALPASARTDLVDVVRVELTE